MIRKGFVYVLVNRGLPGSCKVGRTIRDTKMRADELWQEYGTVYPFVVESKHMVHDCVAVETTTHKLLEKCRVPRSEIFECGVQVAQKAIRTAAMLTLERPWYVRLWHRLILPRPEARSKTLAKGRGAYRRDNPWSLLLAASAVLIIAGLIRFQPAVPDWMPDAVLRTADRIASLQLIRIRP